MHKSDQPMIWIHPVTGDYKVPPTNTAEMPLRYRMQGYEERRFNSYWEHQQWMKSKGLVNHRAEGIAVHEDVLKKNKWGY